MNYRKSMSRLHRAPYPEELDHPYAHVTQWSPDSKAILITLGGHTDRAKHVEDWLCLFDLKNRKASLDLSLMNRGSVTFHPRKPTRIR